MPSPIVAPGPIMPRANTQLLDGDRRAGERAGEIDDADDTTSDHRRLSRPGENAHTSARSTHIADRARLDEVMSRYQPAAIIHFAAYAYVGESVSDPGKYYRNNVAGSLTLLEAARDRAVQNVVFSSSCATYGVPASLPISEDALQQPINPYGASKLMVERMLADFEHAHELRYAILRYFNAAGADPDGELGECHDPETHLIPLAIWAAQRGEPAVFGSDYPTPDGTAIRDYIHVTDLAEAHVLALADLMAGGSSMLLNLGTGLGHSVRQAMDAIGHPTSFSWPSRHGVVALVDLTRVKKLGVA